MRNALRVAGRAGAGVYGSREWAGVVGPYLVTVGLGGLLVVVALHADPRRDVALQGDEAAELVALWERSDAAVLALLQELLPVRGPEAIQ